MPDPKKEQLANALAAMGAGSAGGDAYAEPPAARGLAPDDTAAPAPDPSVFAPKRATREIVADRQLHTKRTLIPILLTTGVLFPAVGSLKWTLGPDSPFAAWSVVTAAALITTGAVLLALAVFNMLQVRDMLRRPRR
jgi:hypothetical protein